MEFRKIGERIWRCRYGLVLYYYMMRSAYFLPWDSCMPISEPEQREIADFTKKVNGLFDPAGTLVIERTVG